MTPMLPPTLDLERLKVIYDRAAEVYFESLPLEHFMEAMPHAVQRKITLESFDIIHESRPDIQCFNELLVQYPRPNSDIEKPGQVVPDNFVVIHTEPVEDLGSYSTVHQPAQPFLVLEYVSKSSKQKDYQGNYEKYEHELKVPYYLLFDLDSWELHLFRLTPNGYKPVRPSAAGRLPIPALELEAAFHDGWVRFWFRGELVPLPAELLQDRNEAKAELVETKQALTATQKTLDKERREREATQQMLEKERQQLEAEKHARETAETDLVRLREEIARLKPRC